MKLQVKNSFLDKDLVSKHATYITIWMYPYRLVQTFWQLFCFNVLYREELFLKWYWKMKGYIIIIFMVSVFFTIPSVVVLVVEDKETQRSIARTSGSVLGAIAAAFHIYYLLDNLELI